LRGAWIVGFAQGFDLLRGAKQEYHYDYALADVARIWRAGCIIRATILNEISAAYSAGTEHLLLSEILRETMAQCQTGWRAAVARGVLSGLPLPTLSAAIAYYDSYRSERLPSNLIQAQRDFFGAHSYQRLDRPGNFHTHWG
jgi:6-phosphogluconate dehydrogenase